MLKFATLDRAENDLMLAIGESVREDINRRISAMGSNVMIILPGSSTANGVRAGNGASQTLTLSDAQSLAALPTFANVAPVVRSPSSPSCLM